jgi:site-specific DNA-methyltransferase (adenine-specific)
MGQTGPYTACAVLARYGYGKGLEAAMILQGDCLASMRSMADQSVHCCITSPPYFGLRDYGHSEQIGLEQTPDEYVRKMVEVFREVRRVLRDDGTLWLNLGDSYARQGGKVSEQSRHWDGRERDPGAMHSTRHVDNMPGFKPKDLIGIPWRVAFALQADGWYLRQDIIWHKPNPMPESVRDRCTKAHEYIFLLSKSGQYYFDNQAIMEPAKYGEEHARKATSWGTNRKHPNKANVADYAFFGDNHTTSKMKDGLYGRNKRSVWTVTTKPYKGAHFATFPTALIEPCVLAGCPENGVVLDPFGGSGTTGLVAQMHNRKFVLCELNPDYVKLAENRIAAATDLFTGQT